MQHKEDQAVTQDHAIVLDPPGTLGLNLMLLIGYSVSCGQVKGASNRPGDERCVCVCVCGGVATSHSYPVGYLHVLTLRWQLKAVGIKYQCIT